MSRGAVRAATSVVATFALLTSIGLTAAPAAAAATTAASGTALPATSSALTARTYDSPATETGTGSFAWGTAVGRNISVSPNTGGTTPSVNVTGNGGNYGNYNITVPTNVKAGTYRFDPSGGNTWLADNRCLTGPSTGTAVVHDTAWSSNLPTRLSLTLNLPCGHDSSGHGGAVVELRYAEPTSTGSGLLAADPAPSSDPSTTEIGTPVTVHRSFRNIGNVPVDAGAATLGFHTYPQHPAYTVGSDGCRGVRVLPGATCTVKLRYAPQVGYSNSVQVTVPDGHPGGATSTVALSSTKELDQPTNFAVAGGLGEYVFTWLAPGSADYTRYEIVRINPDGSPGPVVLTTPGTTGHAPPQTAVLTGVPARTVGTFAVRAIRPDGIVGPLSATDTDSTAGRLLIATGTSGNARSVTLTSLNPMYHWIDRLDHYGTQSTYHRVSVWVPSSDDTGLAQVQLAASHTDGNIAGWSSCTLTYATLSGLDRGADLPRSSASVCDDYPTFTSPTTIIYSHVDHVSDPTVPAGKPYLMSLDTTTGVSTPVSNGAWLSQPAAAPDGTVVAYDPAADGLVRLTPGSDAGPVAIPGTSGGQDPSVDRVTGRIAFVKTNSQYERNVTVVDADGSNTVAVTAGERLDSAPSWSGNRVYFSEDSVIYHSVLTGTGANMVASSPVADTIRTRDFQAQTTPVVIEVPDTTAPTVTAAALPAFTKSAASGSVSVPVQVSANEPGQAESGVASFDAQLASAPDGPWTSPSGWTTVAPSATSGSAGTVTFDIRVTAGQRNCLQVRASDAAGNVSGWTTPSCTTGDATAPVLKPLATPALYTPTGRLSVAVSYSDSGAGVAKISYRTRRAAPSGTFGAFTTGSMPAGATSGTYSAAVPAGYQQCVSFSATDKVGNASAWSTERCVIAALDDRALSTSGSASGTAARLSSSAFHAGTVTELKATRAPWAQLSTTTASGVRIGLVVRTCSGCGTVDVFIGSLRLGRLSTAATTTRNQVVLWTAKQPATRTGKLLLRQVDRKPVWVDAVVISHT